MGKKFYEMMDSEEDKKAIKKDRSSIKTDKLQKLILDQVYELVTSDVFYQIVHETRTFKITKDNRNPFKSMTRELIIFDFTCSKYNEFEKFWEDHKKHYKSLCERVNLKYSELDKVVGDLW